MASNAAHQGLSIFGAYRQRVHDIPQRNKRKEPENPLGITPIHERNNKQVDTSMNTENSWMDSGVDRILSQKK